MQSKQHNQPGCLFPSLAACLDSSSAATAPLLSTHVGLSLWGCHQETGRGCKVASACWLWAFDEAGLYTPAKIILPQMSKCHISCCIDSCGIYRAEEFSSKWGWGWREETPLVCPVPQGQSSMWSQESDLLLQTLSSLHHYSKFPSGPLTSLLSRLVGHN